VKTNSFVFFVVFCIAVLSIRLFLPGATIVAYIFIAMFATQGVGNALKALFICWLIGSLNTGLVSESALSGVGRYLVFFVVAFSVFIRAAYSSNASGRPDFLVPGTLLLIVFVIAHSLVFSAAVDVSILKAVVWGIVVLSCQIAWSSLQQEQRLGVFNHIYWGVISIGIGSMPLIFSPLGYHINGIGFQGILNQPQMFGLTMALGLVLSFTRLLTSLTTNWYQLAMFFTFCALLFLSAARTGLMASIIGLIVGGGGIMDKKTGPH
jgi:hypothetical protein